MKKDPTTWGALIVGVGLLISFAEAIVTGDTWTFGGKHQVHLGIGSADWDSAPVPFAIFAALQFIAGSVLTFANVNALLREK